MMKGVGDVRCALHNKFDLKNVCHQFSSGSARNRSQSSFKQYSSWYSKVNLIITLDNIDIRERRNGRGRTATGPWRMATCCRS